MSRATIVARLDKPGQCPLPFSCRCRCRIAGAGAGAGAGAERHETIVAGAIESPPPFIRRIARDNCRESGHCPDHRLRLRLYVVTIVEGVGVYVPGVEWYVESQVLGNGAVYGTVHIPANIKNDRQTIISTSQGLVE